MLDQLKFFTVAEIVSVVKKFVSTFKDTVTFIVSGEYSDVNISNDMISWKEENTKSFTTSFLIWAAAIAVYHVLLIFNSWASLSWTGTITSSILVGVFKTLTVSACALIPRLFNKGCLPLWGFGAIGGIGVLQFIIAILNIFGSLGILDKGLGWIILIEHVMVAISSILMMDILAGVVRGENMFVNPDTHEMKGVPFHSSHNPFSQVHGTVRVETKEQQDNSDTL